MCLAWLANMAAKILFKHFWKLQENGPAIILPLTYDPALSCFTSYSFICSVICHVLGLPWPLILMPLTIGSSWEWLLDERTASDYNLINHKVASWFLLSSPQTVVEAAVRSLTLTCLEGMLKRIQSGHQRKPNSESWLKLNTWHAKYLVRLHWGWFKIMLDAAAVAMSPQQVVLTPRFRSRRIESWKSRYPDPTFTGKFKIQDSTQL